MTTHSLQTRWLTLLAALAIAGVCGVAVGAPAQRGGGAGLPANRTGPTQGIGIEQKLGEQLPLDLVFRDEEGRPVPLQTYFGERPVIVLLVYYECPMLCGVELDGLVRSLKPLKFSIGQEFEILTVSFDPHETPSLARAKKRNFLKRYDRDGAEDGWHFLTGDEESIRALADAVGFRYRWDESSQQYLHAAGLMIATPQGKLSRYFYGVEHPTRDLELGLVEASANKIGSLTHQVLLFCYQYDPTIGKYGFAVRNALRVGGITTLLVLVGAIGVMLRRERRVSQAVPSQGPTEVR